MDDCIEYKGKKNKGGYGYIAHSHGVYMTHRLAWMLANGKPIPPGQVVMHTCDNPPCINSKHLKLGSCVDNAKDMLAKGRGNFAQCSGRPMKITQALLNEAQELAKTIGVINACKQLNISRAQYYNRLKRGF